jgi:hypothetical protein
MNRSLSPDDFSELLFSHHPNTPHFNDDVIKIFNKRICAGCLLAYPTALIFWFFFKPSGINSIILALTLTILSQSRRFFQSRNLKMFFRFIAGIGLGFGIGGMIWVIDNKNWLLFFVLLLGAGLYGFLKIKSIENEIL